MKRSEAILLTETLGFDPHNVTAVVLRPDEIEVREKKHEWPSGTVWYITPDDFDVANTYDELLTHLEEKAPVSLAGTGGIQSLRWDWRGVSVQAVSGLLWQIPWEDETPVESWLAGELDGK